MSTIGFGQDAIASYMYKVEVDGEPFGQFKEVSGLSQEVQVIEHREKNLQGKEIVKKTPGQRKWGDLTLKMGKTDSKKLWDWFKLVQEGKIGEARKNGSVVIYDYATGEKARWNFINGWPSKVSIGSLSTTGNDILTEEVTIVHEGLESA
jgi:phage tail-like protein